MSENADLVMFSCTWFLKENVYYIKSLDVIVVMKFDNNKLHLFDVFAKDKVNLEKILDALCNPQTNQIVLGFTPENTSGYEVCEMVGDDVLFIQSGKTMPFDENKLMFPLLSHA